MRLCVFSFLYAFGPTLFFSLLPSLESFMPDWKLAVFERASGAVDLCRSKGSDPEESTSTHTHTHKRQTYIFIASNDYAFVSALSFDWGVCVTDLFFNNEFDPAHSYC
ncbi:Transient-receptor-potential-like protein [Trichinella pseudospiralis]